MNRTLATFLTVLVLTGILTALSIAVRIKGYPLGGLGEARLDALASAATFIPLAALYAFSAALLMVLPLRAAAFVLATGTSPLHISALVLLASVIGVQAARLGFGDTKALNDLLDWQFVFAAAIVGAHAALNPLRRNALTRTAAFVAFVVAALACLYWTFRL
ncbi:MAG: hypothetical protein ABTQ31_05545 [Rhizobiaceae bacterium]